MDETTSALARVIGVRIRHERKARKLTLDQLAAAAGVSRRMVINIEQAAANPSVGTLLRISNALGVGLPTLVEPPGPKTVQVTRNGQGAALWTGDAGGKGVLVAGTTAPDVMELWEWTLAPRERHVSEPHTRGTKELIQVRAGTLTLEIAAQSVTLGPGDAVAFSGESRHSYINQGSETVHFTMAVFEPGVGAPKRSEPAHA